MKHYLLPVAVLFFFSCKQIPPRSYYTGLYTIKAYDSTRHFDAAFRPVKIDLFYPAAKISGTVPLSYSDILDMGALRLNYHLPKDSCHLESQQIAEAIKQEFKLDSSSRIFHFNTEIYAAPLPAKDKRKYPVIIYAAGMNGSSWENILLFHHLVQRGYIVAAISSVGLYPGYMSAAVDLEEQVKDILFTRQQLSRIPLADISRVGLLGWSMGGSAITKAAMQSGDFKCLLSFDGTEIHRYGEDAGWDKVYNEITRTANILPEKLKVPYCYLSGEHPPKVDSIYDIQQHSGASPKYFLTFKQARHEDFSSMIAIAERVQPTLGDTHKKRQHVIRRLTTAFFDEYLKGNTQVRFGKQLDSLVTTNPNEYSKDY
jgi:dienelactone hydrolase